jgi:hypothetical protein
MRPVSSQNSRTFFKPLRLVVITYISSQCEVPEPFSLAIEGKLLNAGLESSEIEFKHVFEVLFCHHHLQSSDLSTLRQVVYVVASLDGREGFYDSRILRWQNPYNSGGFLMSKFRFTCN